MKLFDTTLARLERSLDVRLARHNVLSSNVANIDTAGNVSYMIGFLSDLLDDLNNSLPANCNLSSKQGAQAAFAWWFQYNGGN